MAVQLAPESPCWTSYHVRVFLFAFAKDGCVRGMLVKDFWSVHHCEFYDGGPPDVFSSSRVILGTMLIVLMSAFVVVGVMPSTGLQSFASAAGRGACDFVGSQEHCSVGFQQSFTWTWNNFCSWGDLFNRFVVVSCCCCSSEAFLFGLLLLLSFLMLILYPCDAKDVFECHNRLRLWTTNRDYE